MVLILIFQVTFTFVPECDDCTYFNIDSNTGSITSAQQFTGDEGLQLVLLVEAQDGADSDISGVIGPNTGE